ncbi:MAG TPA: GrpB family protein [Candidatus Margulisiibacteriota bacterium]|nr:GrpB family protein [Candidatus Margulisiibacteriota bacterium]
MSDRPLEVVAYDPGWPAAFAAEAERLRAVLGTLALRIDHNGSTAVPGLAAKPVIDIQVSVAELQPMGAYRQPLQSIRYTHVPHPDDAFCPFFHRPREWPHSHHIHVVRAGGTEERRTLAFRDYLRDHRDCAREYAELKLRLAGKFSAATFESRQSYADAKTEFIERVIADALKQGYPRLPLRRGG